jgi:hypothetical protein
MLRTFIQVVALTLTLSASVFLVKSSFVLSAKQIAGLSGTYWDYNLELAKNLSQQQADTRVGVLLLLSDFIFQMINLLWPMRICDFAVNRKGVIIAIIFSIIIIFIFLCLNKLLAARVTKNVENILTQQKER